MTRFTLLDWSDRRSDLKAAIAAFNRDESDIRRHLEITDAPCHTFDFAIEALRNWLFEVDRRILKGGEK